MDSNIESSREIAGALDIILSDSRIWCPPAFVAKCKGLPFEVNPWIIARPYWTAGSNCGQHTCGPELTDEEIVLKFNTYFYDRIFKS